VKEKGIAIHNTVIKHMLYNEQKSYIYIYGLCKIHL